MGDCMCKCHCGRPDEWHRRECVERDCPCTTCGLPELDHRVTDAGFNADACLAFTPAPSPARDDAEKAIAGLLAEHTPPSRINSKEGWAECGCGERFAVNFTDPDMGFYEDEWETHVKHVASVIAAHMAAPDELTALRERIRALADEWSREDAGLTLNLAANDLRMLLGDA